MKQRQSSYTTLGQAVLAFGAVVWGLFFARHTLATLFRTHDDEGYFLLALTRYLRPGPLDQGMFTHYGPFYYYAQQACFYLLGLPVTHDAGRLVTLFYWMTSAALGGVFVYRISRSLLLSAAGTLACIRVGVVLAGEPGHPQQVVLVLIALAIFLSLPASRRNGVSLFLLGAVGAALVFTKINVGVFYLAALAHALLCVLPSSRVRTAGIGILLAYAILAPPLVTHSHLLVESGGYCLIAILCGTATFAWGAAAASDPPVDFRGVWYAVAGAVSGAVLIAIATRCQGVSMPALVEGIIVEPARHPAALMFSGFRLGLGQCIFTVLVVAGLACLGWFRERLAPYRYWVGALRCEVALATIFLLTRRELPWVVSFLPLALIPITGRKWGLSDWFPRLFIADLAATQFLQTFPVTGGQVGVASVPALVWAFICLSDGFEELGGLARLPSRALCHGAAGGSIVLLLAAGMWSAGTRPSGYPYPPSRLKGAEGLHLPPEQAENYRFLAGSITSNCSVLFTMPRLGSFNFWSGVPAPRGSEGPLAMQLFTQETQKPVLDRLASDPRACVLYHRVLLAFWLTTPQDLARLPLATYILDEMPKAAEKGGYEIRINPRRNSAWIADSANSAP